MNLYVHVHLYFISSSPVCFVVFIVLRNCRPVFMLLSFLLNTLSLRVVKCAIFKKTVIVNTATVLFSLCLLHGFSQSKTKIHILIGEFKIKKFKKRKLIRAQEARR